MKHSLTRLRRSLAATVAIGGAALLMAPAIAQVAAGTNISNTATATYEDPNDPGTQIDATSNTVEIVVAEVAGLTVVQDGIVDSTPATNLFPGDTATFNFLIENTGNDTTQVEIPAPVIAGPVTPGTVTYDIDADGDGTFETTGATEAVAEAAVLSPGGQIRVSVPVTVDAGAPSGANISVQLGDADGGQNQLADGDGNTVDVLTLDAPDTATGETAGAPVNGVREASATNTTVVGAQPLAFATVLKVAQTPVADGGTPAVFNDDVITDDLSLRVENSAPTGADPGLVAADLEGTPVEVDTATTDLILVSDAIPAGTTFTSATAPSADWTIVYTTDATTIAANDASWSTTEPATPTRVGFVYNPAVAAGGPIDRGETVTGFQISVTTTGLDATNGGSVANIAQVFGESVGGGTTVVYDESGDQSPSNFNDDGSQGPNTGVDADGDGILDPVIDDGVADPGVDGVDTNNDNTGTGVGGEDNLISLGPDAGILNGPEATPGAVGPTDNNDDYTNQSSNVPAGTAPGSTINPDPVTFTNTIQATSGTLNDVIIFPDDGADTDTLPAGTTVTLTFGTDTATYTYQDTDATAGPDSFVLTSGTAIQIGTIPNGGTVDYTVSIDLPAGTPLSTDEPAAFPDGFPVPIVAVEDTDSSGDVSGSEPNNTTIDRVYTGYLKLEKAAAVRDGVTNNSKPLAEAAGGDFIDYTVTYENISSAGGTGNVTLDADNVVITENGTAGTNTWALDQDGNSFIDTENVTGSASDSTGGTITFFSGPAGTTAASDQNGNTQATDVTSYVNTLSQPVEPGISGTFTFSREISAE